MSFIGNSLLRMKVSKKLQPDLGKGFPGLKGKVVHYVDTSFEYISSLRHRFQRRGLPMISVDTKKRELVGNFKNPGTKCTGQRPELC
jgi:hypothetical protein